MVIDPAREGRCDENGCDEEGPGCPRAFSYWAHLDSARAFMLDTTKVPLSALHRQYDILYDDNPAL